MCFQSIGLIHCVIGGGRDVAYDNKLQHDQVPLAINRGFIEGRYGLNMHEISEDASLTATLPLIFWHASANQVESLAVMTIFPLDIGL